MPTTIADETGIWFAWYPVKTIQREWCWLRTVRYRAIVRRHDDKIWVVMRYERA